MGFTKLGGRWTSKDGDQVGPSGVNDDDEPETAATQEELVAEGGPNGDYMGERMTSMSPFERFMVNRMDNFAENQRNLHDLCATSFQQIGESFNNMDSRFSNLDEQI